MSYLNVRFPDHISYGSSGGPKFNTTVLVLASGYEKRNMNWSEVRAEYNAQHAIKDRSQMEELLKFFYVCGGRAHSFRFKDFWDYKITLQQIGTGTGAQTQFQLFKRYEVTGQSATYYYDRRITKPLVGTGGTIVAGAVTYTERTASGSLTTTQYRVNPDTGVITFGSAPANAASIILSSIEFDVHCRFDTDHFDAEHNFWETGSWPSIPIVEVKEKQAS